MKPATIGNLLHIIRATHERGGYRPIPAGNGRAALETMEDLIGAA